MNPKPFKLRIELFEGSEVWGRNFPQSHESSPQSSEGEAGNHFAQKLPELWFLGLFVIHMVVLMVMAIEEARVQPQAHFATNTNVIQGWKYTTVFLDVQKVLKI